MKIDRLSFFLSTLYWGGIVALMVILSINNQPSIVDDFCFGWIGKDYGIFKGAYLYYTNWSGRYFANLLMHMNPLVFSQNFIFFSISPVILIISGFLVGIWVFKNLFQHSIGSIQLWTLAFTFQAICLYTTPSLYQVFYWFSGIYYYLSFLLAIVFFNVIYFHLNNKWAWPVLFILIFAIIGTNEINMLIFSALFFLYLIHHFLNKSWNKKLILLSLFWILLVCVVVFAPGNVIRSNQGHSDINNVVQNFGHITSQIVKSLRSQVTIYLWFCLAFLIGLGTKEPLNLLKRINLFWVIIFVSGAMVLGVLALALGLNEAAVSERVIGLFIIYIIFFDGMVFVKLGMNLKQTIPYTEKLKFGITLVLVMTMFFNPNFKLLFKEVFENKQSKFAKENKQRFKSIAMSKNDVVSVYALKNTNSIFFMEDFSSDSTHLWCKCVAKYYGKKAVYRVD